MCRHLCDPGIFTIATILLLPLPQRRCCHLQAGVVAFVTIASVPPSMRRHLCHSHNGVVTLVALALSSMQKRFFPHCTGVVVLIALTSLPSRCMGIVTVIAPVLLPLSTWFVCTIALVLSPLSCWHCRHWCNGIISLVTQASLPLLCLHCAVDLQVSLPSLS